MVKALDFLLTDGGDLDLEGGDFVTDFSDTQHIKHIVSAFPGFYRESILTGVGISAYFKSSGAAPEVQRKTAVQLEADNYAIDTVEAAYTPALRLSINAERIR